MSQHKPVITKPDETHSDVEHIKYNSRYLRGTLAESLEDPITGGLPEEDNRILKFHGSYMQDDRDVRNERAKQKLEPSYQFMVRVCAPGGVATPEQWLVLDELARKYANHSLRITTRQAFQLHGVLKWDLKKTIRTINEALMTTLAACGDVSRNVMCNPNPYQSEIHAEVYEWAQPRGPHPPPSRRPAVGGERADARRPPRSPVVLHEPDFEMMVFSSPDRALTRTLVNHWCDHMRNGWAGRHLVAYARRAGLVDLRVEPGGFRGTAYAEFQRMVGFERLLAPAVEAGAVAADRANAWLAELQAADAAGCFFWLR